MEQLTDRTGATNEETSQNEIADFIADPPTDLFAYIVRSQVSPSIRLGIVTTWMGDKLGVGTFGTPYCDNFGSTRVPIRVKGINGADYHGTYYVSAGDYCRLKMTAASRRALGK